MKKETKMAVLLTCHNRRDKTAACVKSLIIAIDNYNSQHADKVSVEVFLTDDGCTDGTVEAVRNIIVEESLHIIVGNGNLFWAGGMRACWKEAKKRHSEWDYYLLLNDDVVLLDYLFDELFEAEKFAKEHSGKEGLVSGITCDKDDPNKLTYGGNVWRNRFWGTTRPLYPNGEPQFCDKTNANILLVPQNVVDSIGIFYDGYRHGAADYDYSMMARRKGFPIVLTKSFCGKCEYDHVDHTAIFAKLSKMSLKERKDYFQHPLHSNKDYLLFMRRNVPFRYPLVWVGRMLNLYCPKFYYRFGGFRYS